LKGLLASVRAALIWRQAVSHVASPSLRREVAAVRPPGAGWRLHWWLAGVLVCLQAAAAEGVDEVIVTATRHAAQVRDFPGSVSAIGDQEIALVGSTHHVEMLNRAAGTMIQRNSGEESLTAIRSPVLSGPGSCGAFLFLENSIPIRPVGFCNVNELFEVNMEQARSIEVLRGPAGVVYGSGAMHGAVNVLQASATQLPALEFGIETGPADFYRASAVLAHQGDRTDLGAQGIFSSDGGWRDQSDLKEQKVNAMLSHRSDSARMNLTLSATNLQQQTAGFIQGEDAYRDRRVARSNANPEAYRDAYAIRLTGAYERAIGDSLQLDLRPYVRHSRMDFLQHFLIGKPTEENGQDSIGLLSSLSIHASDTTDLLLGVDLELADGFLRETQAGPATDGAPAANAIRPAGKHYDYTVDSEVVAAYAQIQRSIGQRWKLSAGGRIDYVTYDYNNAMLSGNTREDGTPCVAAGGCLYTRPASRSDHFATPTAKLGLTYALAEHHTLYASVAQGYRAPDTSELYRLQRQQSVADLDAEKLDSVEIGARGRLGTWRYSLSAFDMVKDHVIFRDANAFNVSDGRTRHRGIEYEVNWAVVPSLNFQLAGTYARHTYDFTQTIEQGETIVAGRDVDTAPRHLNTARLQWQPVDPVSMELEWAGVGRYFVDAANEHEYEGHDLLNLRVAWDVAPRWRGTVRINNLTDRAYADRADYAFGNYRYFPGRRRSVFLELNYRAD
jgi:outer membrane receptor protein involved in Fe transport